jgi:hypothetical protein
LLDAGCCDCCWIAMTLGYCVRLLSDDLYAGKALLVADLLLSCFECCCEAAGLLSIGCCCAGVLL